MRDRYDNDLSTTSREAVDAYIEGVDLFLANQVGADEAFERSVAADPAFALAYAGLARSLQSLTRIPEAVAASNKAQALVDGLSARERGHVSITGHLIGGNGAQAYREILAHVVDDPRDALVVQPCTGVFGLIGFSGKAGREAECLSFVNGLKSDYGEDWWFDCVLAFAQTEVGQLSEAEVSIERSYAAKPSNANAAHYMAHFRYEQGNADTGLNFIRQWREGYDKRGVLHCHISWHEAIWALEAGDIDTAWRIIETDVMPGGAWGPPLNILTDSVAFLLRAELAGMPRREELWSKMSAFASQYFTKPGISFADTHAAIAHAMAGNSAALKVLEADPAGPAGDVVKSIAEAFDAYAGSDWQVAVDRLIPIMASHERIGGSRAQRDLLEFTFVTALVKLGRADEAARILSMRRPLIADGNFVAGLH
ncbi:MAG: tetratricopeptide repeat protein [Rhodospirillaceae bacterium]|nr:tetratricopeptide repeat protein [Rhodospirillaceae bacterium]